MIDCFSFVPLPVQDLRAAECKEEQQQQELQEVNEKWAAERKNTQDWDADLSSWSRFDGFSQLHSSVKLTTFTQQRQLRNFQRQLEIQLKCSESFFRTYKLISRIGK